MAQHIQIFFTCPIFQNVAFFNTNYNLYDIMDTDNPSSPSPKMLQTKTNTTKHTLKCVLIYRALLYSSLTHSNMDADSPAKDIIRIKVMYQQSLIRTLLVGKTNLSIKYIIMDFCQGCHSILTWKLIKYCKFMGVFCAYAVSLGCTLPILYSYANQAAAKCKSMSR